MLVANAVRLWAATRVTERTWHISGENTLGLDPVSEAGNPWKDAIPVTPIMNTQLDALAIRGLLLPLRKQILTALKNKVIKKSRKDWYEIYLTVFIIMCNIECEFGDVVDHTATA